MKPTGEESAPIGIHINVGATEVALKKKNELSQKAGVPVLVDPVLHKPTGAETDHLGLDMRIGPDEVSVKKRPANKNFLQVAARNPVENPPFNNWSVN